MYALLLLAMLVGLPAAANPPANAPTGYWSRSTWEDPDRGFLWYAQPRQDMPDERKPPGSPIERPLSSLTNKELREEIDRLLDRAVEQQTPEAVRAYLQVQQYAMDRASRFSDVFRRTVWTSPELDYSMRGRPANAMAVSTFDAERAQRRDDTSAGLAKTHGMFFFFRAGCPYCHQLAPVLKMYQRTYGMEVFAVSTDGSTLPDFPDARPDNGTARKLNVTAVPALFLADKRDGHVQPIGYGLMSLEDIVTRVHVLTRTQPGEEY